MLLYTKNCSYVCRANITFIETKCKYLLSASSESPRNKIKQIPTLGSHTGKPSLFSCSNCLSRMGCGQSL